MNNLFRISLTFTLILLCSFTLSASKKYSVKSPDGKIEASIFVGDKITYSISLEGNTLLDESEIALQLSDRTLGENSNVRRERSRSASESIISPNYRFSEFETTYNEVVLTMRDNFTVTFRAYNEGVAYRFGTLFSNPITIVNEVAEMNFAKDYPSYLAYSTAGEGRDKFAMAFQNLYTKAPLSEVKSDNVAFLPITVDCENNVKMTLLESNLESYPGMFVSGGEGNSSLKGVFAHYPKKMGQHPYRSMTYVSEREDYIAVVDGTRDFPWRIWAVTQDDTEMPVNNLVYALGEPNRIGDYSWVKTGKVAWEWWNNWGIYGVDFEAGINMETYKHYIDFAAENNIEFVILDEGWYNPNKGDMLSVVPQLDLDELVKYGKSKGVDLILWAVFNVLDDQLEAACKKYSEMGISGFKIDFIDRDDQTAVEMTYRIAEMTAKYKLSLNLHGFYKPTGLNRTFPHMINFEGLFGMEEVKWSSVEKDMMLYDVTMPYIRMMSGPVDYTPGAMRNATKVDFKDIYYNPMSQGTRCHQLAAYVVHDSPLTMLCDNPTAYRKEQECTDFIVSIPNSSISETRILHGSMGESIVTARLIDGDWYVGGMTNWDSRDIDICFDFLDQGDYKVTLFRDGINAHHNASDYKKEVFVVNSTSSKSIHLAPGGGFAMTINRLNHLK